jgi:hypothetical protein
MHHISQLGFGKLIRCVILQPARLSSLQFSANITCVVSYTMRDDQAFSIEFAVIVEIDTWLYSIARGIAFRKKEIIEQIWM